MYSKIQYGIEVYSCAKDKWLNGILDNYFIENKENHEHNTRQTHHLHIIRPNDSYGKQKIQYRGAYLWNSILQSSREVTCCNKYFVKKIEKKWIAQY